MTQNAPETGMEVFCLYMAMHAGCKSNTPSQESGGDSRSQDSQSEAEGVVWVTDDDERERQEVIDTQVRSDRTCGRSPVNLQPTRLTMWPKVCPPRPPPVDVHVALSAIALPRVDPALRDPVWGSGGLNNKVRPKTNRGL